MTGAGRTDTASRLIHASPELVYAAMIDPDALVAWLPPEGMRGVMHAFDAREGGGYRMELIYGDPAPASAKSTENSDIATARYGALEPGRRVVQYIDFDSEDDAFSGTMTMTWSLEPEGESTLVTVTAENVPSGISAADHAAGLASSLANLARYVE
ncbi:SRPBCC family protein [Pelagibacterium sp. 26DY04]|uniref:SRPBCC family protein n=1 Tax=Pelagibacterium sp. 26DY04 TaxID=2967130 RepID=UPI0028156EDF|nr:SRPBCC family protein [Pelagibacterium sp. 26DY04]WMT87885.1 SRPBCC family protein [Pelagibacterium sp. 26DY04]